MTTHFSGRRARLALTLAGAAALALPAGAQQPVGREAPPAAGTPRDFKLPPIRTFTLPNGLKVSMARYGTVPKTAVRLVLRTGNIDETGEQVWLADLTRDLMLEGTTTRSARQIAEQAAGYGGALALSVGLDETSAGGEVLSEFADEMIALVADVVRNPAFPASELPRLKANRLRNLSVARSQQQQLANEKFIAAIYPNHPYGRMFPTDAQLEGYTVEQIRAFHAANYGAGRGHMYVVGRFDETAVEAAIRGAFGDWSAGTPSSWTAPAATTKRVIHLIDRPGAVQSTLYIGLPVIDPSTRDWVAFQVTNAILGGSFGSRITSNIREQKGYTYSPFSQLSSHLKTAYWAEIADVTTNVTGASLKEIFYEIDRLQSEPPSADELAAIQRYLAGVFVIQNSSRSGILNQLQFANLHGLGEDYLRDYVRRIYAVTPADVQRIAREYLKDETMTIVIAGDRKAVLEQIKEYGEVVP